MGQRKHTTVRPNRGRSDREYRKELLSKERGSVLLKKGAPVRVALVYPNLYRIGMANLGFQTVYRLFNDHPEVRCERVFVSEPSSDREFRTLESEEHLSRFDMVGFSFSFELDFFNILGVLKGMRIPLLSQDRTEKDPLIIVGGAVAGINPSPLLPFVDGLLVGEGEGAIPKIGNVLFRLSQQKTGREEKLHELMHVEGMYIPGLHTTVKRHVLPSLESYPTYTPIVTPLSHFDTMFIVEVARGCTRGCLFCAAQKVYYPYRFRSCESLVETVARHNPGAQRVGLESAGLSDYPALESLCETLISMGYKISFSSIRADRVTPELIKLLELGKVRSLAVAPEAGSEKLRMCIGKKTNNDTLREAACLLGDSVVDVLKLYFLIGLPGEKESDVHAISDLVQNMASLYLKDKRKRLRVSINAFVPKAFTEYQWAPMDRESELNRKRKMIMQRLRGKDRIAVIAKSSRQEILQGVLSLGDANVGLALMHAFENKIPWKRAMKERNIDMDSLLHCEKPFDSRLPWDFIETSISKERLWNRYLSHKEKDNTS